MRRLFVVLGAAATVGRRKIYDGYDVAGFALGESAVQRHSWQV